MIIINDKEHRNIQEQVQKNMEDIAELKQSGGGGGTSYTAGNGIDITDNVISVDNTIETKANATNRFVSKANLTDYSINEIIVGDSQIESNNVDLNAVYSQDVKSEVSLEPTSTIIRTMSGTDNSTIGISATEIDITTGMLKYNNSEVATLSDIPSGGGELYMAHILIQPNQVGVTVPSCVFDFNIPITKTDASIAPGLITSTVLDQVMTNTCNTFGYSDPNYDSKGFIVTANGLYAVDNGDSTYTNCLVTAVSVTTRKSTGELIGGLSHFKLYKFENLNRLTNVLFNDIYQIPYLNIHFLPYKLI